MNGDKVERINNKLDEDQQIRENNPPTTTPTITSKKKPILVLINPHSGQGKSVTIYKKKILPFLEAQNIEHQVFITESDSRVCDFLQKKSSTDLLKFKSIVVVSGDGLFHETVNALMHRPDWEDVIKIPLGIVPTGSGNGLAYTLLRQKYPNLDNSDEAIKICCEQVIQDEVSLTDLVKVTTSAGTTIWSFLSIGLGLLADIDIDSEWLRRLGELRFTIYGLLRSVTSVPYHGKLSYKLNSTNTNSYKEIEATESKERETKNNIDSNNEESWIHIEDKFACLYAVQQPYVSRVTKFSPRSTLTDQLIYLTYVRGKLSPCRAVEFMLAIQDGSHEKLSYVTVVPVQEFKFQPLEPSKIVVDGEVIPWSISDGPISARVLPKVLTLAWNSKS